MNFVEMEFAKGDEDWNTCNDCPIACPSNTITMNDCQSGQNGQFCNLPTLKSDFSGGQWICNNLGSTTQGYSCCRPE